MHRRGNDLSNPVRSEEKPSKNNQGTVTAFQGFKLTNVKALVCPVPQSHWLELLILSCALKFLSGNVILALAHLALKRELVHLTHVTAGVLLETVLEVLIETAGSISGSALQIELFLWLISLCRCAKNAALYHFRQGQQGRPLLSRSFPHIL